MAAAAKVNTRSGTRYCYLHMGLHKTGSTSIQHVLSRAAPELPARGLLYPVAGRIEDISGHHNLAWELTHDERYRPQFGSTADMLDEVAGQEHDVILSSEAFEYLVRYPHELESLLGNLRHAGLACQAIVYVRDQAQALPSLYLTLVLLGLGEPFGTVLDTVVETGYYDWHGRIFNFDYMALAHWLRGFDLTVRLRSYDAAAGHVCADFLSMFGSSMADLGFGAEPRENPTGPLASHLAAYWRNRLGTRVDAARTGQLASAAGVVVKAISPDAVQAIRARFADSNFRLADEYGIFVGAAEPALLHGGAEVMYVDRLFGDAHPWGTV